MKYKLSEIIDLIGGGTPKTTIAEYWNGSISWLSVKDFNNDSRYVYSTEKTITELGLQNSSTKLLQQGDVIISARGTVGELATVPFPMAFNQSCYGLRAKKAIVDEDYLYYLMKHNVYVLKKNTHGSVFDTITKDTFDGVEVDLPKIETQKRIASILSEIDEKIELNNAINNNLEQQAQAVFANMFAKNIENIGNSTITLANLVDTVDNRGKTPPLSANKTNYPIIDVKALSGSSRIIDYNSCTKYVSADTYNSWFRSGHPQPDDILISTVGNLAEMKLFLGNIGCIAQNVVGFRSKGISPYYLYQYLNYIKHDLVAYNIGSVQPSIKVTHIIKHVIYVPDEQHLTAFDNFAHSISNQIFANCKENKNLTQLRASLLPKLMSGELDVSEIDL